MALPLAKGSPSAARTSAWLATPGFSVEPTMLGSKSVPVRALTVQPTTTPKASIAIASFSSFLSRSCIILVVPSLIDAEHLTGTEPHIALVQSAELIQKDKQVVAVHLLTVSLDILVDQDVLNLQTGGGERSVSLALRDTERGCDVCPSGDARLQRSETFHWWTGTCMKRCCASVQ